MQEHYKDILDAAGNLPQRQTDILREQLQRWSEYDEIRDAFFSREPEVTGEQKIRELAKQYHYSQSNINKIIYILGSA